MLTSLQRQWSHKDETGRFSRFITRYTVHAEQPALSFPPLLGACPLQGGCVATPRGLCSKLRTPTAGRRAGLHARMVGRFSLGLRRHLPGAPERVRAWGRAGAGARAQALARIISMPTFVVVLQDIRSHITRLRSHITGHSDSYYTTFGVILHDIRNHMPTFVVRLMPTFVVSAAHS